MKREPLLWRLIARLASAPAVTDALVNLAMRTPYLHLHVKNGDDSPYMERWWLFNPYNRAYVGRWCKWLPSIRVHHICAPDSAEHLHSHPWRFRTIILRGWYCERRYGAKDGVFHGAGDTYAMRPGLDFHTIYAMPAEGVWTLFITWPLRREAYDTEEPTAEGDWGFLVDGEVVPHAKYKATIWSRK